jgi:hypothetical protein
MKSKSKDNRQPSLLLPIDTRPIKVHATIEVSRSAAVDQKSISVNEAAKRSLVEKLRGSGHLDLRKK